MIGYCLRICPVFNNYILNIKISKLAGGLSSAQHLKMITFCIQKKQNRQWQKEYTSRRQSNCKTVVERIIKFELHHLEGTSERTRVAHSSEVHMKKKQGNSLQICEEWRFCLCLMSVVTS